MTRANVLQAIVCASLLSTGCKEKLSEAQQTDLLGQIEAADTAASAMESRRVEAVREFFAKAEVETSRCETKVLLDDHDRPASGVPAPSALINFDEATQEQAPAERAGMRIIAIREDLERLRGEVEGNNLVPSAISTVEEQLAHYGDGAWHRYDVVYQVQQLERDYESDGERYPSRVVGRGLVWDYQLDRIVCGAEFDKSLGNDITVYYEAGQVEPGEDDIQDALEYGLVHDVRSATFKAMGVDML